MNDESPQRTELNFQRFCDYRDSADNIKKYLLHVVVYIERVNILIESVLGSNCLH